MKNFFWKQRAKIWMLLALGCASAFCVALSAARVWRLHNFDYGFMLWNLFLAWIPLGCSLLATTLHQRTWRNYVLFLPLAGLWLLFFPNAPYLVTDLIHLHWLDPKILWFDLIMFPAFAWTGFFIGFVSLHWMQVWLEKLFGRGLSWLFALGTLGLSAYGVYLGRFLRWNSWDIFMEPFGLWADIWAQIRHPLQHLPSFMFTVLLATFFLCAYFMLLAYTRLQKEEIENS